MTKAIEHFLRNAKAYVALFGSAASALPVALLPGAWGGVLTAVLSLLTGLATFQVPNKAASVATDVAAATTTVQDAQQVVASVKDAVKK